MDWEGDEAVKKALQAWTGLQGKFASITLGHLVTVFCDVSIIPMIKHCIASQPSVLLSLGGKVKGGVQVARRDSHTNSCAWNNHIPIGALQIYLGPTQRTMVPLGLRGRSPTSAWGLSKVWVEHLSTGRGMPRISETEGLFSPSLTSRYLPQLLSFPLLLQWETWQLLASPSFVSSSLRPADLISRRVLVLYLPLLLPGSEPQYLLLWALRDHE